MKKILVISFVAPSVKHAGGQRLLDLYTELKCINPNVYLALVKYQVNNSNQENLKDIFDEIHILSEKKPSRNDLSKVKFFVPDFDVIDFQYHQAGALMAAARKKWPKATLIFSPMESQFRAFLIAISANKTRFFKKLKDAFFLFYYAIVEIFYVIKADKVVTVSESDYSKLAFLKLNRQVHCIPTCISEPLNLLSRCVNSGEDGLVVVFFAYFGSKTNQEAIEWFVKEVHPAILKAIPSYYLHVVGNGIDHNISKICDVEHVKVIGSVETVADALSSAAVGIAPALSGAGVRGKIHQYAVFGLPCVASPIACDGLAYRDKKSIFIAHDSAAFSAACITLLNDKVVRKSVADEAAAVCHKYYQWSSWRSEIASIYEIDF